MGIVYLAHDADFRLVALKVLRPELAADADFRRRFTREAEAARRVARFCTAPVLAAGIDGEIAYLVTEYVDGPDLASVIGAQGPMNGANLEALAVGVATALAAIHQAGVVHGDLKPSNILLSAVGPRVIDFGIARLSGSADTTQSAVVMGTPPYMAPEQADGRPATAASDVFAWGGVMAYAGAGRPPFGTGPAPQVLYRVVHHVPRLDGLDERLRPLVEQALDKDPARRPTAQQLLDRLLGRESATPALATRMVSDSWTPLLPAPQAPPARRLRVAPVVAVALALLVTAATLVAWRPWDRPTTAQPQTSAITTVTATVTADPPPPPATGNPSATGPTTDSTTDSTTGEQPARPAGDGKALAESDTFVTNVYDASVPVHVRILSLARKGEEVTLRWTLRNDSPSGDEVTLLVLMKGTSEFDLQGIGLLPAGSGEPIHPQLRSGACACSRWDSFTSVPAGKTHTFHAIFGVPRDVRTADVDLMLLGRFPGIPISGR